MNTFAQAVNSNMDELPASHFMDAADGVSILDPSIHCNQINVDWLFNLKGKGALEDGTAFVSKRIKAIKLTDKSKLVGFWSMNIYLTSSDDKNKMFQAERRAERKAAKDKFTSSHKPVLQSLQSLHVLPIPLQVIAQCIEISASSTV